MAPCRGLMSAEKQALELRGGAKARVLGTLAGWIVKAYGWTLRITVDDRAGVGEQSGQKLDRMLYTMWHNRIFVMGPAWRKISPNRKTVVLTSASKDGSALEAAMKVFRVEAIRGSTSRRSRAAMVGLMRKVREGYAVGVTPDGPRGPRYHMQAGVVKLAQASGVPVVPTRVEFGGVWRLNSWDRFCIPWPFSRVRVIFEPALEVPKELDDHEFETHRRRLEEAMRMGIEDLIPEENDQD